MWVRAHMQGLLLQCRMPAPHESATNLRRAQSRRYPRVRQQTTRRVRRWACWLHPGARTRSTDSTDSVGRQLPSVPELVSTSMHTDPPAVM